MNIQVIQNCMRTYTKADIMHPPSYGGRHHAIEIRSWPWDMLGRPVGGSGTPSTATETDASSAPCSFITSTLYLPLCSESILDKMIDDVCDVFSIIIFRLDTISRPWNVRKCMWTEQNEKLYTWRKLAQSTLNQIHTARNHLTFGTGQPEKRAVRQTVPP